VAYETLATSRTPALIIYLLDISASMSQPMGAASRIGVVTEALAASFRQMVFRSTKGSRISPRYRIALYAYSDHVYDLLDGVKTVDQVAALGVPQLSPQRMTNTFAAFSQAEKLLYEELPRIGDCPAPLVCHMTDGEYNGNDPEPVAQRIMAMAVRDGRVLVENIFLSDKILGRTVTDPTRWTGVLPSTELQGKYPQKLRAMSSPLPASYRGMMEEFDIHLAEGALMLLPGTSPELVALGFQMAAATPVR